MIELLERIATSTGEGIRGDTTLIVSRRIVNKHDQIQRHGEIAVLLLVG